MSIEHDTLEKWLRKANDDDLYTERTITDPYSGWWVVRPAEVERLNLKPSFLWRVKSFKTRRIVYSHAHTTFANELWVFIPWWVVSGTVPISSDYIHLTLPNHFIWLLPRWKSEAEWFGNRGCKPAPRMWVAP